MKKIVPRSRSKVKAKFSQKWVKNQRTCYISEAISHTDFILGTKVQPIKAHSMTQMLMILTQYVKVKGQSQISQKCVIHQRTGHIWEAISSTDFIFGTKVQPNKVHSITQVPMTLTQGQGERSRPNFPKDG